MAEALGAVEAVGLASSILTFVDIGYQVVSSAHEIYSSTSGVTLENEQIASTTAHLEGVTATLLSSHLAVNDPELIKLSKKCRSLSQDLLKLLESFQPRNRSKFRSLTAAVSARWAQKDVSAIEHRLGVYRQEINFHLSHNFL
jgi:hypothetical protein